MSIDIRDRIVELKRINVNKLTAHPKNWRKHPESQRAAMSGILNEVGYVDALMVRKHQGGYQIIDGHLRAETTPDSIVPVLVVDLDDNEAEKVLATFDPIAALAESDNTELQSLLSAMVSITPEFEDLIKSMSSDVDAALIQEMASSEESNSKTDKAESSDFMNFSCPLTLDEQLMVHQILRKAKLVFGCDSTGTALSQALIQWNTEHGEN